jgi:predicted ribonuclease toxin of YeeF-YezG toxin-antitoxin module
MTLQQDVGGSAAHDLDGCLKEVEAAAREWGVHADRIEGRFVSALMAAIATSAGANKATIAEAQRVIDAAKAVGETEVGRLKILLAGGEKAIAVGRQAAETAIAAGERAEKEFQRSVAQIAKELSGRLIESSQEWLVLKQTSRNRRDAWMLAMAVAVLAVAIFVGGYAARAYQDDRALSAFYEVEARIAKCKLEAVSVRDSRGAVRPACWLDELTAKSR